MRLQALFFILFFLYSQYTFSEPTREISIESGQLELSEQTADFYETTIDLDGEWEFHWNELLYPIDFVDSSVENITYLRIPELWNGQKILDEDISSEGYATYRLIIKHDLEEGTRLALKIPTFATAYRLYIDGILKSSTGNVSNQKENAEAGYQTASPTFSTKGNETELIIQVSNFHHKKGGTWESIKLGTEAVISKEREHSVMKDLFLVGCLFAMGLYHIMLYYFRQKDKSALYFAVSCISMAVRVLSTGEYLWLEIFPSTSWLTLIRIEFISYFIPIFSVTAFIYSILSKKSKPHFIVGLGVVVGIMSSITLFFSSSVFTHLVPVSHAVIGIVGIYIIYLLIRAIKARVMGSLVFCVSLLFFIGCIVNDMLYQQEVIHTMHLMAIGFLGFIFTQGFMLSYRLSSAFNRSEKLSAKLNDINQNLEKTVEERTKDLTEVNEELSLQNQYINNQKHEIEKVSTILQKRNLEITAGINYAHRIQRSILPSSFKLDKLLGKDNYFVLYQPKDILSGDFYMVEEVDHKIILIAADCTGHGVPGALMSMVGQQILSEVLFRKKITTPHEILAELHQGITQSLQQNITQNNDSIDLSICVVDRTINTLYFAGAKSSILVVGENSSEHYRGEKFTTGGKVSFTPNFKTQEIVFEKGSLLYMYSDGYQDQFGGKDNQKFLVKNFRDLLKRNFLLPLHKQQELLLNVITDWKEEGKEKQTDDILVMGVKL